MSVKSIALCLCLALLIWVEGDAVHWHNKWAVLHQEQSTANSPSSPIVLKRRSNSGGSDNIATLLALAFNGLTLTVLVFQARILKRQVGISEQQNRILTRQHVAAHRPKIIVRSVDILPSDTDGQPTERRPTVHYLVSNVGGSTATIVEGGFCAHAWRQRSSPFITGTRKSPWPTERAKLEAGESWEFYLASEIDFAEFGKIMASSELQRKGQPPVYPFDFVFRGSILYSDENGVKRRTSVWRTCESWSLLMKPSADADYEYSD
jgi:hypothetical protein